MNILQEIPQPLVLGIKFTFFWISINIIVDLYFRKYLDHLFTNRKVRNDVINRFICSWNGLFSLFFCIYDSYTNTLPLHAENTQIENDFLIYFMAYLLFDSIACRYTGLDDSILWIHHIASFTGTYFLFHYGHGMHLGAWMGIPLELVNFPMHYRKILEMIGLKQT